jgi:hypothetical protein
MVPVNFVPFFDRIPRVSFPFLGANKIPIAAPTAIPIPSAVKIFFVFFMFSVLNLNNLVTMVNVVTKMALNNEVRHCFVIHLLAAFPLACSSFHPDGKWEGDIIINCGYPDQWTRH